MLTCGHQDQIAAMRSDQVSGGGKTQPGAAALVRAREGLEQVVKDRRRYSGAVIREVDADPVINGLRGDGYPWRRFGRLDGIAAKIEKHPINPLPIGIHVKNGFHMIAPFHPGIAVDLEVSADFIHQSVEIEAAALRNSLVAARKIKRLGAEANGFLYRIDQQRRHPSDGRIVNPGQSFGSQ